jgi:membrane protease YdiL (CAAX protease family)
MVLLALFAWFGWLQIFEPRLDQVSSPERALALIVGRTMEIEEALGRARGWERGLYTLMMSDGTAELTQAMAWYEELAAYSSDSRVVLHLAILEGEAGRLDRVRERIREWRLREDPFPSLAELIREAYLEPRGGPAAVAMTFPAEAARALPAGWFYDRVAIRWATRAGDRALLSTTREARAMRAEALLWRIRGLAALMLTIIVAGIPALVVILFRRRSPRALRVGTAPLPPPWRGRVGAVVLIHGGAIEALLLFAFLVASPLVERDSPLLTILTWPWSNLLFLPLLGLAYLYLLKPAGLGFGSGLGLSPAPGGWRAFAVAVPALLAVGLLGEWGMGWLAGSAGLTSHWTEWFDSDLVWGEPLVVTTSLVDASVFAALFEETVFRGLVFATLRRKFGLAASAALSAAIFALGHGYGVVGFASVFWSGLLWAWAYQKTGSLLPGMVAHGLGNLLASLEVIALLRL